VKTGDMVVVECGVKKGTQFCPSIRLSKKFNPNPNANTKPILERKEPSLDQD
jgi:hypothetical protein